MAETQWVARIRWLPIVIASLVSGAIAFGLVCCLLREDMQEWSLSELLQGLAVIVVNPMLNSAVGAIAQQRGRSQGWVIPLSFVAPIAMLSTAADNPKLGLALFLSALPALLTWFAGGAGWWIAEKMRPADVRADA